MVRIASYPQHSRQRPDPIRIAGIAGAIAANLALFAFLVAPQSFTLPAEPPDTHFQGFIIPDVPKKLVDPPIYKVDQHRQPPPTTTTKIRDETPKPPPVITDQPGPVDVPVPPLPPHPILASGGGETSRPPVTISTTLSPIESPAPNYPIDAVRDEVTGTVQLELLVGVDGRVVEARVVHTSGDRRLDAAARDAVLNNWRFAPVLQDGIRVQARGFLPVVFTLNGP